MPRPPLSLTSGLKTDGTDPTCCSLLAPGQGFTLFSAMGSFQGCGGWSPAQEDDGPRQGGISGRVASRHGLEAGLSVMDGDREKEMMRTVLGEPEPIGLHRGADTGPAARSPLGKTARPAQPRGDINMGGSDATASRKLSLLSSHEGPPCPDLTDTPCCAGPASTVLTMFSLPLAERHSAASVPVL